MSRRIIERLLARIHNEWQMCEIDCIKMYIGVIEDLGCWPQRNGEEFTVRHFRYWLSRFMLLSSTIFSIFIGPASVYMFWDQPILTMMDPFTGIFISVLMAVAIGSLLYKKKQFKIIVEALNEIDEITLSYRDVRQDIDHKAIWLSKLTYCYFASVLYIISPFVLVAYPSYAYMKKQLIFRYWFPFEFYVTPSFEVTVFITTTTITYGFVVVSFMYAFLMALLIQAVRHLQLLNYNLKHVQSPMGGNSVVRRGDYSTYLQSNEEFVGLKRLKFLGRRRMETSTIDQRLAICVRHHQAISRFVNAVGSAHELFLIQQLNCCVFPVILGIIIVLNTAVFDQKIFYILLLIVVCWCNEALISWLADQVEQQSELVRDAAFGCGWLRASDSFKRSLRIIISRSNQPIGIKIAGCIRLNMNFFFEIIKLTYSYYMSLTTSLNIRPTHD